jgi:hypothetical protein
MMGFTSTTTLPPLSGQRLRVPAGLYFQADLRKRDDLPDKNPWLRGNQGLDAVHDSDKWIAGRDYNMYFGWEYSMNLFIVHTPMWNNLGMSETMTEGSWCTTLFQINENFLWRKQPEAYSLQGRGGDNHAHETNEYNAAGGYGSPVPGARLDLSRGAGASSYTPCSHTHRYASCSDELGDKFFQFFVSAPSYAHVMMAQHRQV